MNNPLELYCVVRHGLVATQGGVWKLPRDAWREYLMILMWQTKQGATLFAEMNGGTVQLVSETFDPSVILAPPETRSPEDDHRRSVESPGTDPRAVGPDGGPGAGVDSHSAQSQMGAPVRNSDSFRWLVWTYLLVMLILAMNAITGCAALPMPLQPQTENNSNMAEGAFLVLATVDTVQTMHIRRGTSCDHEADPIAAALYGGKYPKPGRVLITNLALMTVHTMVASWLDDRVAEAKARGDDSVGPWYVGRVIFHAASIAAEGAAVANNASRGCRL